MHPFSLTSPTTISLSLPYKFSTSETDIISHACHVERKITGGTTSVRVGKTSTGVVFIYNCLIHGCLLCDDVVYVYSIICFYSFYIMME
jgi:hypothetical protein